MGPPRVATTAGMCKGSVTVGLASSGDTADGWDLPRGLRARKEGRVQDSAKFRQKKAQGTAALVILISGHSSDPMRGTENNKNWPSVKNVSKGKWEGQLEQWASTS